jgi:hypothetical protein
MGGLRAPSRLTARSVRARARFNTDCQKKAGFSTHTQPTIRVVLYDLRGVWQSPRFSKLSFRASGPRNPMKITQRYARNGPERRGRYNNG